MRRFLGVGVALVVVVLFVAGFLVYAQHDRPKFIQDRVVVEAAESACAAMTREVSAVVGEPVQAIRARNDAVIAMVDAVRAVGEDRIEDDRPTAAWLDDWRMLVDARARYADDLAAGRGPEWAVPVVDERPITERMIAVELDCAVPPEVAEGR
jgi:hypothetical protein